jgi:hypothetical protein
MISRLQSIRSHLHEGPHIYGQMRLTHFETAIQAGFGSDVSDCDMPQNGHSGRVLGFP